MQQIRNFVEGAQPDPPALAVFLEMMQAFLQGGDQVLAPENDLFGEVFENEGNEPGKEKVQKPRGTMNNEIQGAKMIGEFALAAGAEKMEKWTVDDFLCGLAKFVLHPELVKDDAEGVAALIEKRKEMAAGRFDLRGLSTESFITYVNGAMRAIKWKQGVCLVLQCGKTFPRFNDYFRHPSAKYAPTIFLSIKV